MLRLLGLLFPPKLGTVRMHGESVTLYNIDAGILSIIPPDDSWAGNVKQWSQGNFQLVGSGTEMKTRRPIERFTITYENKGPEKMAVQLKPFSWESQMQENERELSGCGTVMA